MKKKKITFGGRFYLLAVSVLLMIPIVNVMWLSVFEDDGGLWKFVRNKKYLPPYS